VEVGEGVKLVLIKSLFELRCSLVKHGLRACQPFNFGGEKGIRTHIEVPGDRFPKSSWLTAVSLPGVDEAKSSLCLEEVSIVCIKSSGSSEHTRPRSFLNRDPRDILVSGLPPSELLYDSIQRVKNRL
jgi:hypothetical protein